MSAGAKLATFGVGGLALFGAAFGVGRAVGPVGGDQPAPHGTDHVTTTTAPAATTPTADTTGVDGGPTATGHPAGHDPAAPSSTTHPVGHEEGQP